ncbi:glycoside hydrolase family protein [Shewanella algae]|uniref:glycoside hydrolase family protein n=1 Tax=Shewanella algae TaxID=38313 RepID=UPI001BF16E53|nr:lysozyme [Shewanella algae]BCV49577.1 lysozyme [Shewanella algae]
MRPRIAVAGLSLSAAAFITLVTSEGFAPVATVPVQGDRPTGGFGSTYHADGRPVKLGEKFTPINALKISKAHIDKDEIRFRDSLPGASLNQTEYDLYIDWVYQYGIGRWLDSPMRQHVMQGEYRQACDALLLPEYRTVAGYDCSTPGNKRCYGVWLRAQERHQVCVNSLQ